MEPPLLGKSVLVTREESLAKKFTKQLESSGADVYEVPLLKISCRTFNQDIKMLRALEQFDWLFFTSINGVNCFFESINYHQLSLPPIKIAVVGHKTEAQLEKYGYKADFLPSIYDGETFVKEFLNQYEEVGQVLLVQGNRSRDVIAKGLLEASVRFQSCIVYDTVNNDQSAPLLQKVLRSVKLDFITFTSPSTVEAFVKFSGEDIPEDTTIVCIGHTTEARARELGFQNTISPVQYTTESMIEVMCNH
ncbi:uroporphyrinogen-III synthase [Ornithinibacillus halotolerans]|uniref:Uroporphyrinogen-III synthase n=1 Tax=Ornithinibacillus halotolerans TaxID=1274357 RepID=A0A916S643_9BACI|nr:uroporphyrinogen-III synthase [Ornithinibacillus halotolerans]GGA86007.1 uroporphyrinogen-III synthase [Ornithinibacillus halotolerans]